MQTYLEQLQAINWDFPQSGRNVELHSIHPYPAKFIPEIPYHLLKTIPLPKNSWVFDPFCGSGVTIVEAQQYGAPSCGIDLNPIACLISTAKTQTPQENLLHTAQDSVAQAKLTERQIAIPDIPNLAHWFDEQVQHELAALISPINATPCPALRDLLRLAFSSIVVRVSNQDSDTRYAAVKKRFQRGDVYKLFLAACERIQSAKCNYQPKTWERSILHKDILQVTPSDIGQQVGLVITSPPYPNAYEYWLYHKYRMYWLDYDPIRVKEQEIGARAHYFKKNPPTEDDFCVQIGYLMNLLYTIVVNNGHVCIVIGRSKIHGKIIDNSSLIVNEANKIGFELLLKLERNIAQSKKSFNLSHANIKTEDILIFRK